MRRTVFLLALAAACSDSSGGGGGPEPLPADAAHGIDAPDLGAGRLPADQFRSYCSKLCRGWVACGVQGDLASCIDGCNANAGWLRGDLIQAATACVESAACADAENCQRELDGEPLEIHRSFVTACEEKYAGCSMDAAADGYCSSEDIPSVNTDTMNELMACFDMDCSDFRSCLASIAATYGFTF